MVRPFPLNPNLHLQLAHLSPKYPSIPIPRLSISVGDLRQQAKHQKLSGVYSRDMTPFCGQETLKQIETVHTASRVQPTPNQYSSALSPGHGGTVPMAGCGGGFEEAIRQGPAQSTTVLDARL